MSDTQDSDAPKKGSKAKKSQADDAADGADKLAVETFDATQADEKNAPPKKPLKARVVEELKFFSTLAVVLLALLTGVWGHFKIPSESMLPTLEVGDHLYVSKFAYGYSKHSLPFVVAYSMK